MPRQQAFVFDTNVLSVALRAALPRPASLRLASLPAEARLTTSITVGELLYGVHKRRRPGKLSTAQAMVDRFTVLPFDHAAAERYAVLRADLEARGRPLDEPDLRVAAITLVAGATLVTGNIRHFERVTGLSVENWLEDT